MKRVGLSALVLMLAGVGLRADSVSVTNSVGLTIPDNDINGLATTLDVNGLSGAISSVTVGLNIAGGYNGDLYAYLVDPNGDFAVLLNRVGVGGGNTNGYGDSGFNITLNDSGSYNNIHYYQQAGANVVGGVLQGTWASDGENVNPEGNLVGSSSATATLLGMDGSSADGSWVLYVADLSPGGISQLNDWTLTVDTLPVPEPGTWALLGVGGLFLLGRRGGRLQVGSCFPCKVQSRKAQDKFANRGLTGEGHLANLPQREMGWMEVWR